MVKKLSIFKSIVFVSIMISANIFSGCNNQNHKHPTDLIAGLKSYSSANEIKNIFTAADIDWVVPDQPKIAEHKDNSANTITQMKVKYFCHAGVAGSLNLGFFDNKLVSTWFYPNSWERYQPILNHIYGTEIEVGKKISTSIRTEVSIETDYQKRNYVLWRDISLSNEAIRRGID